MTEKEFLKIFDYGRTCPYCNGEKIGTKNVINEEINGETITTEMVSYCKVCKKDLVFHKYSPDEKGCWRLTPYPIGNFEEE